MEVFIKKLLLVCLFVAAFSLYAAEVQDDVEVRFHDFPWGTSIEAFTARVGQPVHVDEFDGLKSLLYKNLIVSGYPTFMVAYFSDKGLEGGVYYFHTFSLDELMECYKQVQSELLEKYGMTLLRDIITREMRPYESAWNSATGYIYLNVNTRRNEPVSLLFSSPALTRRMMGS